MPPADKGDDFADGGDGLDTEYHWNLKVAILLKL